MVLPQSPAGTLRPTAHSLVLAQPHSLSRTPHLPTQWPAHHLYLDIHKFPGIQRVPDLQVTSPVPPAALHLVSTPRITPGPCLEHRSQPTSSLLFSPAYNSSVSPVGSTPESPANPPLPLAPFLGHAFIAARAQNWSSCLQRGLLQNS